VPWVAEKYPFWLNNFKSMGHRPSQIGKGVILQYHALIFCDLLLMPLLCNAMVQWCTFFATFQAAMMKNRTVELLY